MDGFSGILLKVDTLNPHHARGAVAKLHEHFALTHDRVVKLADLVALRQVGIEVVLAVKSRDKVDLGFQPKPCAHGLCDAFFVDDGQHAGHACVHKGHVAVRLGAKERGGPGKQLGPGRDLSVHLKANHQFPIAGGSGDDFGGGGVVSQVQHVASSCRFASV